MKHSFALSVAAVLFLLVSSSLAANDKSEKSWQSDYFGTELVNTKGDTVSPDAMDGKIVAMYFSAQWCPPCRAFTPQLVKFYNELKAQGKALEIVLVSFDRKAEDMTKYMSDTDMQWLAIPYQSAKRNAVIKKFQVRQIPTLIILNAKGQIISTTGKADVEKMGTKIYDQWASTQITAADAWYEQYLGKLLTNSHKDSITTDVLHGKFVGIYHSASWCGPCRHFTPELVKFYDNLKKVHKNFEIVLINEDETKDEMISYMKKDNMQWLALPFDQSLIRNAWNRVSVTANVGNGIPTLVIFGPDGSVISSTGRKDVVEQGDNAFKLWTDKYKAILDSRTPKKAVEPKKE